MFSDSDTSAGESEIIELCKSESSQRDLCKDNHKTDIDYSTCKTSSLTWHPIKDKSLFSTYSEDSSHLIQVADDRTYHKSIGIGSEKFSHAFTLIMITELWNSRMYFTSQI